MSAPTDTIREALEGMRDAAMNADTRLGDLAAGDAASRRGWPAASEPYVRDADFTLYNGDCLEVLQGMAAGSVDCCVTSPPYWGLRDYGVDGQLGLEATPAEYVARMVAVFREVRRVLSFTGTCWLNLGDSYAGGGTTGRNDSETIHAIDAASGRRTNALAYGDNDRGGRSARPSATGLKPKDLIGIPWRVALALHSDGWNLRSGIIRGCRTRCWTQLTDRLTPRLWRRYSSIG